MLRKCLVGAGTQSPMLMQRRFGGGGHHHGVLLPEMKNNKAPNEKTVPKFIADTYDTQKNSQTSILFMVASAALSLVYVISFLPKEYITGPPKKHDGDHH
eukprot:TRINITY_DN45386_c0_g1_i1.p1 TRINITY_DN45386_c0_g1~~TRINITY_DN45386_c0_g1_i1.p1  ORF type:complete len:100 (-),score=4.21 TRINITY_DN45386_c0_g1_i1:177-476(-)